jgi:hypothetical protein
MPFYYDPDGTLPKRPPEVMLRLAEMEAWYDMPAFEPHTGE